MNNQEYSVTLYDDFANKLTMIYNSEENGKSPTLSISLKAGFMGTDGSFYGEVNHDDIQLLYEFAKHCLEDFENN